MAKRFCFTIDGNVFHALLQENNLTEQLEKLCPFEIDLQKRGGHEYYTRLFHLIVWHIWESLKKMLQPI